MEKRTDTDQELLSLNQTLTAAVIQLHAMVHLMIEKGLITKEEYYNRIRRIRESYEEVVGTRLPFFDSRALLLRLGEYSLRVKEDQESVTHKSSEENEMPAAETGKDSAADDFLKTLIPLVSGKVMPRNVSIAEGRITLNDPESANRICSSCTAQNTAIIASLGARNICELPELLLRNKLPKTKALEGVNSRCWMHVVSEKMLDAVANGLIRWEDLPHFLSKTAENIDLAINDNISEEGIFSIIDCAVLEAQTAHEDENESSFEYNDIDWQH
ncbi:MAG: hypothetical protein AB7S75_02400 [Desulfococcaceae bacterium]